MRSLAGDKATEDLIKVKWLALLQPNTKRVLKVLRGSSFDDLAAVADEVVESQPDSYVMATSSVKQRSTYPVDTAQATPDQYVEIKRALAELIAVNRDLASRVQELSVHHRERSSRRSASNELRANSHLRTRSPSPAAPRLCFYHKKFGADAIRCLLPCSFKPSTNSEN